MTCSAQVWRSHLRASVTRRCLGLALSLGLLWQVLTLGMCAVSAGACASAAVFDSSLEAMPHGGIAFRNLRFGTASDYDTSQSDRIDLA